MLNLHYCKEYWKAFILTIIIIPLFTSKPDMTIEDLYRTKNVSDIYRTIHFTLQINRDWILINSLRGKYIISFLSPPQPYVK